MTLRKRVWGKAIAENCWRKEFFFPLLTRVRLMIRPSCLFFHIGMGGNLEREDDIWEFSRRGNVRGPFVFINPCRRGIFTFVLDSVSRVPLSSLFLYWNYWKMVFVVSRAEEEGCLQLELRNVSSAGLRSYEAYSQVTPEICRHVCI